MNAASRPSRRQVWPYALLAIVVMAAIALAFAWTFRLQIAKEAAGQALSFLNLGDLHFEISEVESDRIRLENLKLGEDGPSAEAAEITFSAAGLASGAIKRIRIINPKLALRETDAGAFVIVGLPDFSARNPEPENAEKDNPQAPRSALFPALPDFEKLEIIDGQLRITTKDIQATGHFSGIVERTGPGRFKSRMSAVIDDGAGQAASFTAPALDIHYTPEAISLLGQLHLSVADERRADPAQGITASIGVWLDQSLAATGAVDLTALITNGAGRMGGTLQVADIRGSIHADFGQNSPAAATIDLQLSEVEAMGENAPLIALRGELAHGAVSVGLDANGPSGFIGMTVDAPQNRRFIVLSGKGDIDASLLATALPDAEATGRVLFEIDLSAPTDAILTSAGPAHLMAQSGGTADITLNIANIQYGALVQNGGARGVLNAKLAGSSATLTTPGLMVSGVKLPPALLASFPPDVARAFREPAFLRVGGPSLGEMAVTLSQRPDGGFAATGKIAAALSNPNLALFLESDAALSITPDGKIERITSDALTVRLVDAAFGPAKVSGRIDLTEVNATADSLTAQAKLSLHARGKVGGYRVKSADIDVSGPLTLTPARATLSPAPGGRIRVTGFSGPLLTALDPVRLTLQRAGKRRITYDRLHDRLNVNLAFNGFKTRALLNSEGAATPLTLALGGGAVDIGPRGVDLSLRNASGVFPSYDIAVEQVNARVRLGASAPQNGRLTVGRIRHTGSPPAFSPLSLNVDLKGRGKVVRFTGALRAAQERAILAIEGQHDLSNGLGEARFQIGPVVFAPGVMQPQDFAPSLYRLLLETIGQISATARIAWSPEGLTDQTAASTISLDKLRTGEVTIEQSEITMNFAHLFPPRTAGPQRVRIGRLDVGVPLTHGLVLVDILSPNRIEVDIRRFELFGGIITSQRLSIDPTAQEFDAVLEVTDIDLASILAFAEFGELSATGTLEGRIPIRYRNGEVTIHDGLLRTGAEGGVLRYRPRAIDKALEEANEGAGLAVKALSNFAYDEISIRINEIEAEKLRLDIKISGKSLDLYDGIPFEFNIVIEGPIRQIIQDNLAPPQLPPDIQDLIDRSKN